MRNLGAWKAGPNDLENRVSYLASAYIRAVRGRASVGIARAKLRTELAANRTTKSARHRRESRLREGSSDALYVASPVTLYSLARRETLSVNKYTPESGKARRNRLYERGQCARCTKKRHGDSVLCVGCLKKHRDNCVKNNPRKGTQHCRECGKPGHNVLRCPVNPDRQQP